MARAMSTDSEFSDSTTCSGERWARPGAALRRPGPGCAPVLARCAGQQVAHPAALRRAGVGVALARGGLGRALEVERAAQRRIAERRLRRRRRSGCGAGARRGAAAAGGWRLRRWAQARGSETSTAAAGFRNDVRKFLQRVDLLGDGAADGGGRFLCLFRHLDDALLELGAGKVELALDGAGGARASPRSRRRSAWWPNRRRR